MDDLTQEDDKTLCDLDESPEVINYDDPRMITPADEVLEIEQLPKDLKTDEARDNKRSSMRYCVEGNPNLTSSDEECLEGDARYTTGMYEVHQRHFK